MSDEAITVIRFKGKKRDVNKVLSKIVNNNVNSYSLKKFDIEGISMNFCKDYFMEYIDCEEDEYFYDGTDYSMDYGYMGDDDYSENEECYEDSVEYREKYVDFIDDDYNDFGDY